MVEPTVRADLRRWANLARAGREALRFRDGATPHRVVARRGPARLRAFEPEEETGERARPLLIVAPFINRWRIVDLEPGRSLVGSLVARGIPVRVLDWGVPRAVDAGTDLADLVETARWAAGQTEARATDGPVDVLGYCLGGTLAVLLAARHPDRVRRLATIHAPVDFSRAGLLAERVREPFPVNGVREAFGNAPGWLVHQGFAWMDPVGTATKWRRAWPRFTDEETCRSFVLLESWNLDGVPVHGAAWAEVVRDLYRENRLVGGTLELRGRTVDLGRVRGPVLCCTAERDPICPPPAARALLEAVESDETAEIRLPGGHVRSVVGPDAPARLHEPLADWILS